MQLSLLLCLPFVVVSMPNDEDVMIDNLAVDDLCGSGDSEHCALNALQTHATKRKDSKASSSSVLSDTSTANSSSNQTSCAFVDSCSSDWDCSSFDCCQSYNSFMDTQSCGSCSMGGQASCNGG